MIITKQSAFTGIAHTMELDITEDQLMRFEAGGKVHIVFPHLNADQREFLLTGVTKDEWDAMFPPEDSDFDDGSF